MVGRSVSWSFKSAVKDFNCGYSQNDASDGDLRIDNDFVFLFTFSNESIPQNGRCSYGSVSRKHSGNCWKTTLNLSCLWLGKTFYIINLIETQLLQRQTWGTMPCWAVMLESGIAEAFKRKLFCHALCYTTTFDCLLNLSLSGHGGQKSLGRICCNVPGWLQYCSGKLESLEFVI